MTSKADQKRSAAYSRASVRRKLVEKIGFDTVVYKVDEDDATSPEFYLPHPMMYDKDTRKALKPLADDDSEGIVKVLLGDQYDKFIAAGGEADDVTELIGLVQLESQQALRTGTPLER